MARALARGWGDPVLCTDSGSGRAQALADELGGEALASNRELAERADLVILAHKPAQLAEVAWEAAGAAKAVVSLLARTPQADVRSAYPGVPVFRIEPNTAAEVGRGVHAFAIADAQEDAALREQVRELFARSGTVVDVPERLMTVAGACSGVGPAYWALLVEAWVDAAVKAGMPAPMAGTLVRETMAGSAELLRDARHAGRAARGRLARAARPPAGWRRSSAAACVPRSPAPWTTWWAADVEVREQIAEFLGALLWVYTIIVIAWVIFSFVFAMGVRVPYSRPLNAVLDFLRDVTEPFLRIFRRLPLRVGPLDLTPIVALLTLRIVGGIVVGLIDPGP